MIVPNILSPREEQIVELSSQGLTDKEIAVRLQISIGTLNTYWTRARRKLRGTSRTELAASVERMKSQDAIGKLEAENQQLRRELAVTHEIADEERNAVLELIDEGVVIIDADGMIRSFSPGAESLLGYAEKDVVGTALSLLMPEPDAQRHQVFVDRHVATGRSRILGMGREVHAVHQNGQLIRVWVEVKKIFVGGEWLFVGVMRAGEL